LFEDGPAGFELTRFGQIDGGLDTGFRRGVLSLPGINCWISFWMTETLPM